MIQEQLKPDLSGFDAFDVLKQGRQALATQPEQAKGGERVTGKGSAPFGALMAKTVECNRLNAALQLACSHLTGEQVEQVSAAMPDAPNTIELEQANGIPFGYMNAGYAYEMQQGRMPYAHVYKEQKVGADIALYTHPAPAASAEREARVIEQNARKAAQEQLYAERERHTAEVKRLQAEIGRLKAPAASVSDEREAFEAEMRCKDVWGHRSLVKRPDGRYQNWQVDAMWDVWQARAALRPAQAGVPDDIVKDAQRYRWLRKSLPAGQGSLTVTLDDRCNGCFNKPVFMDSLDAAIDAAMLAAAPKEGGAA